MAMRYEPATGPCSGHAMPGTVVIYNGVLQRTPVLAGNGIYNCRNVRGGHTLSCHGEGRAADFSRALPGTHSPDGSPIPEGSLADQALHRWISFFVANCVALGIQRCIYKRLMWTVGSGYTTLAAGSALAIEHNNHLHVEQTREMSKTLTKAQFDAVADGAPPTPPLPGDDDMILMSPHAQPIADGPLRGRWPFYSTDGNSLLGYNGAPLKGSVPMNGLNVVPLPPGHRPILGLSWTPDGQILVAAGDGGTFVFPVA